MVSFGKATRGKSKHAPLVIEASLFTFMQCWVRLFGIGGVINGL